MPNAKPKVQIAVAADGNGETPRQPRTARGAATRRRLIEAAREELVERNGVLEIDPVAVRAEVSVGAIYRHFDSRAGLIAAVVDDFYARYRAEALERDPAPGGGFAERERERTELSVAFHYADPLARVILEPPPERRRRGQRGGAHQPDDQARHTRDGARAAPR